MTAVIGPVASPQLHLVTLNVRRRMPTVVPSHRWSRRLPLMLAMLAREQPSVLAIQEASADQSADIRSGLGSRYAAAGTGRDAHGGDERCEVLIDTERLRFVKVRAFWLSDRPDVRGSRSFGNLLPRVAVHVELHDLGTGGSFTVIATHFDHLSGRSRLESAHLLHGVAASLEGPVIVMGDFNAGVDSEEFRMLTSGGVLVDTWEAASRRLSPEWGTYSRFRAPRRRGQRIDWLLVSPTGSVEAAAINAVRFGHAAISDHESVHAVLRWPELAPEPAPVAGGGRRP